MAMLAAEFFPRYEGALLIIVNGYSETVWFCFAVTSTTNRPFLENFHAYCGCFLCIFECVIYYQFFFFLRSIAFWAGTVDYINLIIYWNFYLSLY